MAHTKTYILGIESSCDDTSAAVSLNTQILSNVIATQKIHELYGGIVPELASRAHLKNIIPVVSEAIKQAGITLNDLDAIAFTKGPGLLGSLLVGTSFAKALSLSLNKPLIDVHHMKAHIMAHFIDNERNRKPSFPFLCLTVSGGHTQIVKVSSFQKMEVIGSTIDDAAGEAFDKCGKIMGLVYPGGPLIDKLAQNGDPKRFQFAKPKVDGLNFSFSGLKTSFLYFIQGETRKNANFIQENLNDLCASLQQTILDILFIKLELAVQLEGITEIAIAGGVSANQGLRERLQDYEKMKGWNIYVPEFQFCTDNAGMIAVAGYYHYLESEFTDLSVSSEARSISF
ncbi:MAG: tRNA (adenosine(37)-N6)-threonylcarbamoyltransferase complex transferase subunit TsaD [Crocinitomicaceae bacterium]|nr:tRNA (adenosine(37)-N6)-threonylcarbamoyltransferase complex transferase subunit TsaD [Crocinitomicaceae bacterium]MCF8410792.1 tRNA (adenosine(37)-N6)-threonylcarbamoyltransferase complex transferase subunit TsaD [Crocinitomicaceae bacterium]MCF8444958.1 tRNA (adenosine(37)-N6)-threonylcarbamoyltransferase complex transferase subunit TsaD [Crocinitomicaceae bacterium]